PHAPHQQLWPAGATHGNRGQYAEMSATIVSWTKASTSGERVPARGGHTCVVADFQLVVFGGTFYKGNGEFTYLADTWVLDIESMTWQEVRCGGDLPDARYGHSCHLVGSRMFIVGGKGRSGQLYRDVHFLDLVDWTWVAVNATSTGPSPRFWQASVLVGHKIVVHGGWNGSNHCYEDLWVFDTDSFAWMQPRTGGLPPTARYGHAMVLLPDGRILLSGGATIDEKSVPVYHKDLRQLDTETMLWSKAKTAGGIRISSRCNHTLTSDEEGRAALLFGGWGLGGLQHHENNKQAGAVTLAACSMLPHEAVSTNLPHLRGRGEPEHKYGHTCVSVGNAFFVFGGWNGQQACNEIVVFELESG
ncbi:unnamed protein product, partial [Ectocarpus sp. 4 AP-2014]